MAQQGESGRVRERTEFRGADGRPDRRPQIGVFAPCAAREQEGDRREPGVHETSEQARPGTEKFEHQQLAAGGKHAPAFGERLGLVGEVPEPEGADDQPEMAVGESERSCASPVRNRMRLPASFVRAMSTISGVMSSPVTSASGKRRSASAAKSPVPQARSRMDAPDVAADSATRRHLRSSASDITRFMRSYRSAMEANNVFMCRVFYHFCPLSPRQNRSWCPTGVFAFPEKEHAPPARHWTGLAVPMRSSPRLHIKIPPSLRSNDARPLGQTTRVFGGKRRASLGVDDARLFLF